MNTIGSAGTLVAAGLATAGQYLQSVVLDLYLVPFGSSIATLIFLFAVVGLFYRVAIFSDFRGALMLLFGATLFGVAVFPRAQSFGVKWEFGARTHDDRIVGDSLKGIYDFVGDRTAKTDQRKPFEVSWLFAKYDQIVTGIVQSAVKLIGVTSNKDDLKFLTRTSNYQQLLNLGVVDSQMQFYLHSVLFEKCAEWIGLYQALIDPSQFARKAEIERQIDLWIGKAVLSNKDGSYQTVNRLYTAGFLGEQTNPLPEKLSCDDLWGMAVRGLKSQAYSQSAEKLSNRLPEGLSPDEMILQAAIKFGDDEVGEPEDVARLLNALSARMIIGAFRERYPALSTLNMLPSVYQPQDDGALTNDQRYAFTKKLREESLEKADASQGEYFGYVAAMPYMQGIIMFFLAISYPIFALMLLTPTRVHAYMMWFGLWFWVKLWDFGFAVVMKVDSLLYYLIPHGPALDDSQMGDPGEVLRAVLAGDPTATIMIYWDVMAMLIAAVPIVTAIMTWVGGSVVMYQVQNAMSGYAENMSQRFMTAGINSKPRQDYKLLDARKTAETTQSYTPPLPTLPNNTQTPPAGPPNNTPEVRN
jgi:hypothetical protein